MSDLDRALDVLLDAQLAPIVDMVARHTGHDRYEVASADGAVTFRRTGPGPDGYQRDVVTGADPLADQSSDRLVGLEAERADPHPPRATNSYPYAFDHVAQLFDHPACCTPRLTTGRTRVGTAVSTARSGWCRHAHRS